MTGFFGWRTSNLRRGAAVLLFLLPTVAVATANRLAGHPSPYLAMHAADPVAWQPPDAEAVAMAKREHRLLLVSIGYFACHWCHVMQRESFRDPEIARLMNENFVPVKADREVSGALDAGLQNFAARTRGQAGWPLNVFITPDGYPLAAVMYSRPDEFRRILAEVAERWRREGPRLAELARQAAKIPADRDRRLESPRRLVRALVSDAMAEADLFRGGFGQVAKFPNAPRLLALLDIHARTPDRRLGDFLVLTLDAMRAGGLWDHVGGGFFRYTIDPDWHTPHFEKMLYDNALLALAYLRAADVLGRPGYAKVAADTLDFLVTEMRDPGTGGFYASASAVDATGREGAYYLYSAEALVEVLSAGQRALAEVTLGLSEPREFEHGWLPVPRAGAVSAQPILDRLRSLRATRDLPRDRKVLAGWNGLMLQSLAQASLREGRFRAPAVALAGFLRDLVTPHGDVAKGLSGTVPLGPGELGDYAYVAAGLDAWGLAGRDPAGERLSRHVARAAVARFRDAKGWRTGESGLLADMPREAHVPDGALPSPSAVIHGILRQSVPDRAPATRFGDAGIDRRLALEHATEIAAAWRRAGK